MSETGKEPMGEEAAVNKQDTNNTTAAANQQLDRDKAGGSAASSTEVLARPSFGLRLGEDVKRHDLAPIHSLLLDLAISLQVKVNLEIQNIGRIRRRLSMEM